MTEELPLLDEAVVAELRASVGDDDAFMTELVTTYLAEGGEYLAQLESAASAGNIDAVVRPAHSMKSSSAALGAARMAHVSRELEFAGREGRSAGMDQAVAHARATWDATVAELRTRGLAS